MGSVFAFLGCLSVGLADEIEARFNNAIGCCRMQEEDSRRLHRADVTSASTQNCGRSPFAVNGYAWGE